MGLFPLFEIVVYVPEVKFLSFSVTLKNDSVVYFVLCEDAVDDGK